jgi:hypothetical protein
MAREKDEYLICDQSRGARLCGGRIGYINEIDGHRELLMLPGWELGLDRVWHEPPRQTWRRERRICPSATAWEAQREEARSRAVMAGADVPP